MSTQKESPPPTQHALQQYVPPPESARQGMALCLSGGGYRALLFHLGAARRLNELGLLSRLRSVSSVSGGSLLAAKLGDSAGIDRGALRLLDWEDKVARPLRRLAKTNIRTPAILQRLLPWNWFRDSTGVEALARRYERDLTAIPLQRLPERPDFLFCATDMAFGVNWTFTRADMGDYQAGYATPDESFPLARAVAASSCFPPVFNPLPIDLDPADLNGGKAPRDADRDALIRGLRLTDGGNYDNLGLEPVWKSHQTILCSDGGLVFDSEADHGLFWRLKRYLAIIDNQSLALRKRWLIGGFINRLFEGTYWGVASAVASYEVDVSPAYSKDFARGVIGRIRTDFDAFSDAEVVVLENHGYTVAEAALRRHLPQVLPDPRPPFLLPHPWIPEDEARPLLRGSHKSTLLGRF